MFCGSAHLGQDVLFEPVEVSDQKGFAPRRPAAKVSVVQVRQNLVQFGNKIRLLCAMRGRRLILCRGLHLEGADVLGAATGKVSKSWP